MPENLEQMLQQAGNAAPAPAPAADPSGTGGAAAPTGSPATPSGGDADELPGGLREYLAANPDHKGIVDLVNGEMKKAWTPKLQEAADLRKLIEGLDHQSIQDYKQLRKLAAENPQALAAWMRQQADLYAPAAPTGSPPAQPGEFQPVTDSERVLWEQIQAMRKQQEEVSQRVTQQTLAAQASQVNAELNTLQQQFGVEIPVTERAQAWTLAQQAGIPITQAIWAVAGQKLTDAAARKARDEAAGVVAAKQTNGAGNPGAITNRTDAGQPAQPTDFKSIFAAELAAAGRT